MGNLQTPVSVQKLQTVLQAKAKEEPDFRFYLLYASDGILSYSIAVTFQPKQGWRVKLLSKQNLSSHAITQQSASRSTDASA